MQFHKITQLGLYFVVQTSLSNQTFVVLNQPYCVRKSLDPSPNVVEVLNKDGA